MITFNVNHTPTDTDTDTSMAVIWRLQCISRLVSTNYPTRKTKDEKRGVTQSWRVLVSKYNVVYVYVYILCFLSRRPRSHGSLVRANEALGEEGPDGPHDGKDRGYDDEEVGEETLAGGDFVLEEAEVECQGKTDFFFPS